jgi:2-C-methyl-D-erythritol 4-phosphate cytidylyltransferase
MTILDRLAGARVAALIPAAGSGQRMGGTVPKPYQVLQGREILARTLDVFEACAAIDEVWLVVAADLHDFCRQRIVEPYGFRKVRDLVAGGAARQESVWRGLQRVSDATDLVVVHDGVRPFVTASLLQRTLDSAVQHGAAIAAVPLHDTLKRVSAAGQVEATIPRERLWRTQTPQAFRRTLLLQAFEHAWQAGLQATDEAALVEALGHPVHVVPGIEQNVKITTPDDLDTCEGFLRRQG